jgi:hypothetical protein
MLSAMLFAATERRRALFRWRRLISEGVAKPSAPMMRLCPPPGAPTGEEMRDLERLLDRKITQNEIRKRRSAVDYGVES